jgi:hypothetical protein
VTVTTLVAMAAVAVGCVLLWLPTVEGFVDRRVWWFGLAVPSMALGLVGLLAAFVPDDPAEWVWATSAVLSVLISTTGGGPVTMALLRGVERSGFSGVSGIADVPGVSKRTGIELAPTRFGPSAGEVLRGGAWIGILERAAIAVSLLVGLPEGVAVVIAIKGLARYPELRVPGASERFIIGTFVSGLWAAAAAGIALLIR